MISMLLSLVGCIPDVGTVQMFGEVRDAPYAAGSVVDGATLEVKDIDGDVVGTATTAYDGTFAVDVPAGVDFFVEVDGDASVPTHFSGVSGLYDFDAGDGYPWLAPTSYIDQLREDFANCPSVNDEGAIVAGEVRIYVGDTVPGTTSLIDSAEVRVVSSSDEVTLEACYLDDDGVSLEAGVMTGATGRFAVFGVPAGLDAVEVLYNDPAGDEVSSHPQYIVAEGGFVPMFPAWAYTSQE